MSVRVVCGACRYKLKVPSRLAGRRVTCPKCGHAVQAPEVEPPSPEKEAKAAPADPTLTVPEIPLSTTDRLGRAAMMLGLLSILIICVPQLFWLCVSLSGVGLIMSMCGVLANLAKDITRRLGGKVPVAKSRRDLPVSYPIAGATVCTIALALILLPWLRQLPFP